MSNEAMDQRDILEKLMDFDRCGLTPGTRVQSARVRGYRNIQSQNGS